MLTTSLLWAQDISVTASLSSPTIALNEAAQLTITVVGAKDDITPPDVPKIEGFAVRFLGPSTQISIVNGQYSSQRSFIYNLFPAKTGHLQIPAITLNVGGADHTTAPLDMEVTNAAATPAAASTAAPTAESLKDRIFLQLSTPKARVYVGEKVPVSIRLFVNSLPLRNIQFPVMEKNGFVMDGIGQPQQYSQELNGVKYDVVDFSTYIYPTRAGDLDLGPVRLEGNLLYKTERSASSGGGLLNDDFFRGFFDNYQARPITLNAEALKMHVLDLPEEGRPANFSGAVGQLDFIASVAPSEVKVGDPLTLRMKVSGSGNFKSLEMPVFNDSRFKAYDPQTKDEGNARTLEQVIIPTADGITQVPALAFSYFDPMAGEYKAATQGPFAIKIAAAEPGHEFKAVGFSNLPQGAPIKVEQVDYVQEYVKKPIKKLIAFCRTPHSWAMALGFCLIVGGWSIWRNFRKRLISDDAFARKFNASKNAKQGLAQMEKLLKAGDEPGFYAMLHKTLSAHMRDKGLKEGNVPELKAIYESCDLVRFAGVRLGADQMQRHLEQTRRIVKS